MEKRGEHQIVTNEDWLKYKIEWVPCAADDGLNRDVLIDQFSLQDSEVLGWQLTSQV